jgi:hypothetical protein
VRRSLRLSEFSRLTPGQQRESVAELARAAHGPANGELRSLQDEISAFERRYEFTSAEMVVRVRDGRLQESLEICRWLMSLEALRLVSGVEARA